MNNTNVKWKYKAKIRVNTKIKANNKWKYDPDLNIDIVETTKTNIEKQLEDDFAHLDNKNRRVLGLHGVYGFIILTGSLVSIIAALVYMAIDVQKDVSQDYYYLEDVKNIKMFDSKNSEHLKLLKDK